MEDSSLIRDPSQLPLLIWRSVSTCTILRRDILLCDISQVTRRSFRGRPEELQLHQQAFPSSKCSASIYSVYLFIYLSIYLSIYLPTYPSICLSNCPSISVYACVYIYVNIRISSSSELCSLDRPD